MYPSHRLDTPPPPSQFRRPWSPEPQDFLPSSSRPTDFGLHAWRRETSDDSVEALDLADYAMTLRQTESRYPSRPLHRLEDLAYPPSPPALRPFASRDSLTPPSLVSAGTSSSSRSDSNAISQLPRGRNATRRPFSVPPLSIAHYSAQEDLAYPHNHPYISEPEFTADEPAVAGISDEFDVSQFPAWSRSWYQNKSQISQPLPAHAPPLPLSLFDPSYQHSESSNGRRYNPYAAPSSAGHSSRDLLPWSADPPEYGPPLDAETKEERMRMLEREFGAKATEGSGDVADERVRIGGIDQNGNLVTKGPKKRVAMRVFQILFTLAAVAASIYAALVIKVTGAPPPKGSLPDYALYVLSIVTLPFVLYLFVFRPCCCGPRKHASKSATSDAGLTGGMMVLPVQGAGGNKKRRAPKRGKNAGGDAAQGVQVNLIVDPSMFGHNGVRGPGAEEDEDFASLPGAYDASRPRRPRRLGIADGLKLEEQWISARRRLRHVAIFDGLAFVLWATEFVLILLGKRCPSGSYNGWCDAYNVGTASACLLALAFATSMFFDIVDLHMSRTSPRTRGV